MYGNAVRLYCSCPNNLKQSLNRILRCQSGISLEMALRLSKALGRSPESWLAMQDAYDLWHAGKKLSLDKMQKVPLTAA
ncbi:HigA family addiction module antitoxin [Nitrincola tapanii]|uniref:Addiction module antidote protein, HigA family n=1 Tax=Nitrincola tapanii TaxID=1708751 RepID=A0A5A9VYA3_9GAMM|nr:HigA family addiction module antitoxin [Nitrincola tapanii]KAA0873510.1 addiction module antidote protein, HigA family [Nitrincola tapanii]